MPPDGVAAALAPGSRLTVGEFGVTLDWLKETPGYDLSLVSLEDGVRVTKRLLSRERLDPAMFLD